MTSKTIALSGAEIRVSYGGGTNVWLRNDGTATVYASTAPGVTAGADGTVSIPAGQAAAIYGACGAVYLLGTGSVQLVGSDYTACPFKVSTSTGGESGVDEVARGAIAAHEGNADIHISAAEKATWDGKVDETDFTDHKNDTTVHVTAAEKSNWVKWIPRDIDILNDSTYESPYESYINDTGAVNLGIVSQNNGSYWHILYLRALPGMGYGLQIAMPLNAAAGMPCYRKSEGAAWDNWRRFADDGNADTLGGLHANEIASNPELLINPDFAINQRGKSVYAYTNGGYGIDNWLAESSLTVSQNDDGTLSINASDTRGSGFYQRLEKLTELIGQTVTLSICAKGSGSIALCANGWGEDIKIIPLSGEYQVYSAPFTINGNYNAVGFYAYDGIRTASVTVKWIKLELGSIATPFVPPDPATELLKCQRYYQVRTTNDIDPLDLRPSMRTITDIKAVEGGYAYVAEL